jgi:hypothetical protein
MQTGLSECAMGVSSRSAIVLEFDCPFLCQRASYPLERDLILENVCIYDRKSADRV